MTNYLIAAYAFALSAIATVFLKITIDYNKSIVNLDKAGNRRWRVKLRGLGERRRAKSRDLK